MQYYLITVNVTTVFLCNLYSYMFRHFRAIIKVLQTTASLNYTRASNCSCWQYNYKI